MARRIWIILQENNNFLSGILDKSIEHSKSFRTIQQVLFTENKISDIVLKSSSQLSVSIQDDVITFLKAIS
jgi:hypothetical protein